MRNLKRYCMMMATLSMVVFGCVACGSEEDTKKDTPTQAPTVEATAKATDDANKEENDETAGTTDDANQDENADGTITADEAVELVKAELGDNFGYVAGEELVEKDGSQYYEVYVSLVADGHSTTVTTFMVKNDGTEVIDKYAEDEIFEESTDAATDEVETITADEAVELVKAELGDDYGYIAGESLVEKDGGQYYEVYVSVVADGHSTTVTTYMVKNDGTEVFDKYAE